MMAFEWMNEYLSFTIIYMSVSYKRRKILDFIVMKGNSSLGTCILIISSLALFFFQTTFNVDFGNKTNM